MLSGRFSTADYVIRYAEIRDRTMVVGLEKRTCSSGGFSTSGYASMRGNSRWNHGGERNKENVLEGRFSTSGCAVVSAQKF